MRAARGLYAAAGLSHEKDTSTEAHAHLRGHVSAPHAPLAPCSPPVEPIIGEYVKLCGGRAEACRQPAAAEDRVPKAADRFSLSHPLRPPPPWNSRSAGVDSRGWARSRSITAHLHSSDSGPQIASPGDARSRTVGTYLLWGGSPLVQPPNSRWWFFLSCRRALTQPRPPALQPPSQQRNHCNVVIVVVESRVTSGPVLGCIRNALLTPPPPTHTHTHTPPLHFGR